MDPPLIHEASFSTANPSSYTLSGIWPFGAIEGGGVNLVGGERDGSVEESTVTEQSVGGGGGKKRRRDLSSEDETSKIASTTTTTTSCSGNELDESNNRGIKPSVSRNENSSSKADAETSSAGNNKASGSTGKPSDPPKQDYIHVRARRGQATDSHSLAERARREKISERMKILQDLVPGCNKVIGKALVLDEIINYIQSLQRQVEFLSMKLETVNSRMNLSPTTEGFHPKDLGTSPVDVTTMMFGPQVTREYVQGSQPEWLHMQIGGSFERAT